MNTRQPDQRMCKHSVGFFCHTFTNWDQGPPALFLCNMACGYFLNFDPDKYPEGVAYLASPPVVPKPGLKLSSYRS